MTGQPQRIAGRYGVALVLCALLTGCASTRAASATQPAASDHPGYIDLLEAVFRHQFDHNESAAQRKVDFFFLSLDDVKLSDPPQALMARFKREQPVVLSASLATHEPGLAVKHATLGGSGLLFRIWGIQWRGANAADVEGGYYEGGESSAHHSYRVERRRNQWIVTKDALKWIS